MEIISIVGGVASVVTIAAFFAQSHAGNRKVKVSLGMGFETVGPYAGPSALILTAANTGSTSVGLSSWGFSLPGDNKAFPFACQVGGDSLPAELSPGKCHTILVGAQALARSLAQHGYGGSIRVAGFYGDQTGKVHKTRTTAFDIDEWASSNVN